MVNSELLEYIKLEHMDGTSHEAIRNALLKTGWNISDLDEAYRVLKINGPDISITIPKVDKLPAAVVFTQKKIDKLTPEIMQENATRFTPVPPDIILKESAERGVPASAHGTTGFKRKR